MAFDLSSITKSSEVKPPICIFYGVPGIGKTTLLADAPGAVFVPAEDGAGLLQYDAFPRVTSYAQVLDAITTLSTEEHGFKWLVIDTLSALQTLVFKYVCETGGKNSIEEFGYGRGYVEAAEEWQKLIDGLIYLRDTKGIAIALLAHTDIATFHNPEGEDYDRYNIALDKRALKIFKERADVIGFMNYKTYTRKAEGSQKAKASGGLRTLYLKETPAFIAKNRFNLPDEIAIPDGEHPWQNFQTALENAINSRGKDNG